MLTDQQLRDIYAANLKPRHNAAGVNVGCYVDANGMMREAHRMGLEAALQAAREARGEQYKYHGHIPEFFDGHNFGIDDAALAIRAVIQEEK